MKRSVIMQQWKKSEFICVYFPVAGVGGESSLFKPNGTKACAIAWMLSQAFKI